MYDSSGQTKLITVWNLTGTIVYGWLLHKAALEGISIPMSQFAVSLTQALDSRDARWLKTNQSKQHRGILGYTHVPETNT